jgi:diguanylate cyclase (GGDEF)-like protein
MVDLGEAPAQSSDRRRAVAIVAVLALLSVLVFPVIMQPLASSYAIFAIVIALSISAIAITAVLLWAQARVTESVPLAVLAVGYQLTAVVMLPYMFFYRGLWPQLSGWISAAAQSSPWLWVEWHALFIGSALAYYVARDRRLTVRDADAFKSLQRGLLWFASALFVLTVPALIWIDDLPILSANGRFTPLFSTISYALIVAVVATILFGFRTSRFRSVLDLWVGVACLSMFADITLQHFSRQFSAGWYASRVGILIAANAVLWVLLFQTAMIYAQLVVTAERLRNESLTDVLTGLSNRRAFDQRFVEMMRDCAREKRPVALLMIDVDNFKAYNDAFGHQVGDDCLRAIGATLMNNAARARDLVARFGGEELAVIMPGVDLAGAIVVAERMRAAVEGTAMTQGVGATHPVVTISVGVTATRDAARTNVEDLVSNADLALYNAKFAGRNRVVEMGEPVAALSLPDA